MSSLKPWKLVDSREFGLDINKTKSKEFLKKVEESLTGIFELAWAAWTPHKSYWIGLEWTLIWELELWPELKTLIIRDFNNKIEQAISILWWEKCYVEYYLWRYEPMPPDLVFPTLFLEFYSKIDKKEEIQSLIWKNGKGLIFSFDDKDIRTHRFKNELDGTETKSRETPQDLLDEIWSMQNKAKEIIESLKSREVVEIMSKNVNNVMESQ
ncbi:MAG: hypothetical protein ACD_49C00082G0008 [uncultured bacterium (gcode 4)]|uniref:Uncharacterized protein n=1 Tax=uncultured bacterium (gcode 4) TaxID=1234023 RepID=K2BUC0_9BACT|nr:MAG: hypothetical protein ACD_49C00082G0008 [uncultured bacterium (gcode 4)]